MLANPAFTELEPSSLARPRKARESGLLWALAAASCLVTSGCGQVERARVEPMATGPDTARVIATRSDTFAPDGSDAAPQVSLARLNTDGSLTPIPGEYTDAVEFRSGQAAVTVDRQLYLVSNDGSRSVLARRLDGLPARAATGALVYAARFGDTVEIYWLTPDGSNQRIASFQGSATRLSPQDERRVVFVGARRGGVSGAWIADSAGARCLSNCALRVGEAWGDAYRMPPGDTSKIRIVADTLEWETPTGVWESAPLKGEQ